MLVLDFINVGNGDAILVREMDGGVQRFAMLVDCGHDALQRDDHPELGDPNSRRIYAGDFLRKNGVTVETGVLEAECQALNQVFFHFIRTGRPYVVMKYAMTLDGKIATRTGASQWITGEAARRRVHQDRHRCTAILAGVGTVLADDPLLTCRMEGGKNPLRVICDTRLRTPLTSRIVQTARAV